MYINKLDVVIDNEIDLFFQNHYVVEKLFSYISEKENYTQYSKQIATIIDNFIKKINNNRILEIVQSEDRVVKIISIIKKYIYYYIFLSIAYSVKLNDKKAKTLFINNIIDFSREENLGTEFSTTIIQLSKIAKDIEYILSLHQSALKTINKKVYEEAISFLNELGGSFTTKYLMSEDKKTNIHNLAKVLIYRKIYINVDKRDLMQILEDIEKKDGEYRYIDIVVDKDINLSYSDFERIYGSSSGAIYDLLTTQKILTPITDDIKIDALFQSSFIIPITDEFLRFHDQNYYTKIKMDDASYNRKEDYKQPEKKKIVFMVEKINNATDLYSSTVKNNKTLREEYETKYFSKLSDKKSIIYNDYEELKVIDKLLHSEKYTIATDEYYLDLLEYRKNAYINFRDFNDAGFVYINYTNPEETKKTMYGLRYNNIRQKDAVKKLELRNLQEDTPINVVGFYVPIPNVEPECSFAKDLINVKTITWSELTGGDNSIFQELNISEQKEDDGYSKIMYYLFRYVCSKEKSSIKKNVYYIFDEKDVSILKLMISKLYDLLSARILKTAQEELDNYDYDASIKIIEHINRNFMDTTLSNGYDEYLNEVAMSHYYAEGEEKIKANIITPTKKKLPIYKKKIEDRNTFLIAIDVFDWKNLKVFTPTSFYTMLPYTPYIFTGKMISKKTLSENICQHHISFKNIKNNTSLDMSEINELLTLFIEKYLVFTSEKDFVCKSCAESVPMGHYFSDVTYDTVHDKFVANYTPIELDLLSLHEYKNYSKIISRLFAVLEKLCLISGLPLEQLEKTKIVKNTIDLVLLEEVKSGVKLSDSLLDKESNDPERLNHYNILIVNLLLFFVFTLNDVRITNLSIDKFSTLEIFKKYKDRILDEKIKIKDVPLAKYHILGYVFYVFSYYLYRYKLWMIPFDQKPTLPVIQRTIIMSIVNIINLVLANTTSKNYVYLFFSNQLFQLINLYNERTDITETIYKRQAKKLMSTEKEEVKQYPLSGIFKKEFKKWKFSKNKLGYGTSYRLENIIYPFKLFFNNISNATNCSTGKFHKYKNVNGSLACEYCNKSPLELIDVNKTENTDISNKYKELQEKKIFDNYCEKNVICGEDNALCAPCKNGDSVEFHNIIMTKKNSSITEKFIADDINSLKEKEIESKKKTIYDELVASKKMTVDDFITHCEKYIGYGTNIGTNDNPNYLNQNVYIIDHQYNGAPLLEGKKQVIVLEKEGKILEKDGHTFYKKDVIYYKDVRLAVMVFYDAETLCLIGHKKDNKEYVHTDVKKYLKINYSIAHKIKYFGFSQYFLIPPIKDKIIDKNESLRKIINFFIRSIYQAKHFKNINEQYIINYEKDHASKLTFINIINTHAPQLSKLKISGAFSSWKYIENEVVGYSKGLEEKKISASKVVELDERGKFLISYLLSELDHIITIESNPTNFINYIIQLVNYIHQTYYKGDNILELNKFKHQLESDIVGEDIIKQEDEGEITGIYGDYVSKEELESEEYKDKKEEDKEREDAIDIDTAFEEKDDEGDIAHEDDRE